MRPGRSELHDEVQKYFSKARPEEIISAEELVVKCGCHYYSDIKPHNILCFLSPQINSKKIPPNQTTFFPLFWNESLF